jgi:hypothetical protein
LDSPKLGLSLSGGNLPSSYYLDTTLAMPHAPLHHLLKWPYSTNQPFRSRVEQVLKDAQFPQDHDQVFKSRTNSDSQKLWSWQAWHVNLRHPTRHDLQSGLIRTFLSLQSSRRCFVAPAGGKLHDKQSIYCCGWTGLQSFSSPP